VREQNHAGKSGLLPKIRYFSCIKKTALKPSRVLSERTVQSEKTTTESRCLQE